MVNTRSTADDDDYIPDADADADSPPGTPPSAQPPRRKTPAKAPKRSLRKPVPAHHWTNLYDALADRAHVFGVKKSKSEPGKPKPPDEVLGRRKNAPKGGIPFPKEGGRERELLPNTDLVMAIHEYASEFYARHGNPEVSFKSLDETALLAMGILLEESVETMLGKEGHGAFVRQNTPPVVEQIHGGRKRNEYWGDERRYTSKEKKRKIDEDRKKAATDGEV